LRLRADSLMMLERNSSEVAAVIAGWIESKRW